MLEIKVILHPGSGGPPGEVANMKITQVGKGEGNLRDYAVSAWHQPLLTRGRLMLSALVEKHDRTLTPWDLILEAITRLR